jgi:hypothetical protein
MDRIMGEGQHLEVHFDRGIPGIMFNTVSINFS